MYRPTIAEICDQSHPYPSRISRIIHNCRKLLFSPILLVHYDAQIDAVFVTSPFQIHFFRYISNLLSHVIISYNFGSMLIRVGNALHIRIKKNQLDVQGQACARPQPVWQMR